ncbi:hypothetical protein PTTG_27599 [Puccinia triticina 1-1 BBBD Race 1]|uniref:Uncharacterized protein n=1 Tax=Puccinia triticina (isolate 1-1 / race 1 (BBBD)) TaxID=630390 RepID=A0A180GKQ9_PUCT1|nr:hypothetical protein PTTG_27599 [Puccinia triticina 1-1 BBBD Race 1]
MAQPPKNGFEGLEAALPDLQEGFLKLPEEEPLPPDTGIPPALYQPRETSIALASSRSTPVLRPIDREKIDLMVNLPLTSQPPSQTTNPEGMTQSSPPSVHSEPSGPMHLIPEEEELLSLISMFNEQFNLFVRAREAQNTTRWEEQPNPSLSRMDTQRQATQPGSFPNDLEQRPRTAELAGANNPASFATSHSAARQLATYSSDADARTHGLSTTSYGAGVPGSYPLEPSTVSATAAVKAAPREPELPRSSNAAAATAADAPSEAATSFYTARSGSVVPPQPESSNWRTTTPLILKATGEDQR